MKDIIEKCGGEGFPRIKIGVGAPTRDDHDMASWVLSKLSGNDGKLITAAARDASAALEMILAQGIDHAMEKYNATERSK